MTREHLACVISTLVVRRRPKPTRRVRLPYTALFAVVAELVDALASGASVRWNVGGEFPRQQLLRQTQALVQGLPPTRHGVFSIRSLVLRLFWRQKLILFYNLTSNIPLKLRRNGPFGPFFLQFFET